MTEALCWELESKVTAEYAYTARTTYEFTCYCPHEACLARVYPKQRVNTYFYAPDRHVAGCPNEARSTESSLHPSLPKPRPVDVPAKPIPNALGPGPTIKQKLHAPTKVELLQLAAAVRERPALHPGTLEEVIDAWRCMTPDERATQPLAIANRNLTYATAFTFLGNAPDNIDALNVHERIIFGAATVVELEYCYLIDSRKRFQHEAKKFPLRTVLNKRNLESDYLPELVDKTVTFFWHGVSAKFDGKGNMFRAPVNSGSPYTGIVLKAGGLAPWTTAASKNASLER
ncbi:hypothetical protein bgla_1g02390 [Burkholderia gladioli BSR3]|uniref:Uncharacterized protein n=2 Tax=Burkholderia gladioli TaxID=28095 RepID=F2LHK8_BURGS|nr:hypothetical protein bgla_1g02390 [Burkholderia gladioli BSR3]